jgi:hypothetical protein
VKLRYAELLLTRGAGAGSLEKHGANLPAGAFPAD